MRVPQYVLVSGVFLLGLTQCSKDNSPSSTQNPSCVPHSTRLCVGPGACQGAQACGDAGSTWSTCDCGTAAPDGGSHDAATQPQADATMPNYVLIDDMEGTAAPNGPIKLKIQGANLFPGYWFGQDSSGHAADSISPNPFSYSELASPHETMSGITSTRAAHVTCVDADLYGYCEIAFWLAQNTPDARRFDAGVTEPDIPVVLYNISAYTGLVFWGMSAVSNRVKMHISDLDTDPLGGKCGQSDAATDQCWDDFCAYVNLTTTWQKFEIKFSALQQEGWGYAAPSGRFDATTAGFVNFQVNGPSSATAAAVNGDFWIDDIYFE